MKLRALLVLGPTGVLWCYQVVTFLEEQGRIRVISVTMPHARITWKGSGWLSEAKFERLEHAIQSSSIVSRATKVTELPHGKDADFRYTFLFSDLRTGAPAVFADLDGVSDRAAAHALSAQIAGIEQQLTKTYSIDSGPDLRPFVRPYGGLAIGIASVIARDVPKDLDVSLERAGYSALTTSRLALGPSLAFWIGRWNIAIDPLLFGFTRHARGPHGAMFALNQKRLAVYASYALVDTQNLVVLPALHLGWQAATARMDPRAPPLFAAHYVGGTQRIDIAQEAFTLGLSIGCDYEVPLWKKYPRQLGLIFGSRLGYAIGFPQTWYEKPSGAKLEGGPNISGSGPFARLWVGLGIPF